MKRLVLFIKKYAMMEVAISARRKVIHMIHPVIWKRNVIWANHNATGNTKISCLPKETVRDARPLFKA